MLMSSVVRRARLLLVVLTLGLLAAAGDIPASRWVVALRELTPAPLPVAAQINAVAAIPQYATNIVDYGAIGNASYANGGGADDTAAIQAAINAAVTIGQGSALVAVPGNRTYRITSTLNVPASVALVAVGNRDRNVVGAPMFVWGGANGGVMVSVSVAAANTVLARFQGISFNAGTMIANKPATAIRFEGNGQLSPVDTGTVIQDCWFYGQTGNAVELLDGATNFYLMGGRFDEIGGYGIYVDDTGSQFFAQILGSVTWAQASAGKGFLYVNGETSGRSFVQIDSLHTEAGMLTQTFASGASPFDRQGIIRLGVAPGASSIQHRLTINNWDHNTNAGVQSHSLVQVTATSGTTTQAFERMSLTLRSGDGMNAGTTDAASTNEIRMLGGFLPTSVRPSYRSARVADANIGIGPDATAETVNSQTYTRHGASLWRGFTLQAEVFADLGTPWMGGGAPIAYVTDSTTTTRGATITGGGSNKVIAWFNGTNWVVM